MGIDWENILGDNNDMATAYDNMIDDTNDDSFDEMVKENPFCGDYFMTEDIDGNQVSYVKCGSITERNRVKEIETKDFLLDLSAFFTPYDYKNRAERLFTDLICTEKGRAILGKYGSNMLCDDLIREYISDYINATPGVMTPEEEENMVNFLKEIGSIVEE